jgi:glycosyltransferase involved in cell wall biosynthesis
MKIAYILSQYPSLNETFIAREMGQMTKLGHEVVIGILRPNPPSGLPPGLQVAGVRSFRAQLSTQLLLSAQTNALRKYARRYPDNWREVLGACLRKPSRAAHLIYIQLAATWIAGKLAEEKIQYLHSHFLHSEAIAAWLTANLLDIPYGITAHTTMVRHDRKLVGKAVLNASVLAGHTHQALTVFKDLAGCSGTVIRSGIDFADFPMRSVNVDWPTAEPPLILAVGSLIHPKGFHVLIQACKFLRDQGTPFFCRIVGEGSERPNLENLVADNGLQGSIELPGAMAFKEVKEQFKQATVFVMPSVPSTAGSDGLPAVLLEALAFGVPSVATKHAGLPEMVRHLETGLLAEPGDAQELALCISQLLKDPHLRSRLALQGRALVEDEFELGKNVARLSCLFEEACSKYNE